VEDATSGKSQGFLDKFITVVKSIGAFWLSVVTLPPGHG
jgi:hypothetical protein